jgi:hypothetical protein
MKDIVDEARDYLAHNAAESGADVLIAELIRAVEGWKKTAEIERARREQAMEAHEKAIDRLAFVSSCFGPPDIKGPDGMVYTLKDDIKLQSFEAVRKFLHKHLQQ